MRKINITNAKNAIDTMERRKNFYIKNGWQLKDSDEFSCVLERTNRAGYIVEVQIMVDDNICYECNL